MHRLRLFLFRSFFFCSLYLSAQIPTYYTSDFELSLDSQTLLNQISELTINNHGTFYPYTSIETDTWDILRLTAYQYSDDENIQWDTDLEVFLIYGSDDEDEIVTNDLTRDPYLTCHSFPCEGLWNREHIYARSIAIPILNVNIPGPGTDVHNLFPCDSQQNTIRSNRLFGTGVGNSKINEIGDFYPGNEWIGDVARILMYMHIRYPDQCDAAYVVNGDITYDSNFYSMPDLLLEWNAMDPVSDIEISRNNIIYAYQGNRNPFIDNPYLATLIWGGPPAEDKWGYIDNDAKINQLEIYPLICSNEVFISNNYNESPFVYSISNIDGDVVQKGQTNYSILLESLNKGAYFISINNKKFSKTTTIYVQ